jgi:ribosomal protein S14
MGRFIHLQFEKQFKARCFNFGAMGQMSQNQAPLPWRLHPSIMERVIALRNSAEADRIGAHLNAVTGSPKGSIGRFCLPRQCFKDGYYYSPGLNGLIRYG